MKRSRILIVEDEGIVAMELASRIESMGYVVAAVVDTGEAAIAAVAQSPIDLALVDVRLKGDLSGTEAVMRMRAQSDVPVVFLTAYSDDETLEHIKRCEPRGYLLKPFDERTLWVTVETALYAHEMTKARAAAESARRRSEAQRVAILQHSPDAIISIDAQQRIISWNEGATRIFDYVPSEILGQTLDVLVPAVAREGHRDAVLGFARSDRGARRMGEDVEISGIRKSGESFPADVSISKLEIDGEVVLTAFVRDISARRAMELKLEQTKRLEALGRLAGGVAHDFNNLLVGVFGYARLLKQSFAADDRRIDDVEEIERAAKRAAQLVRELLAYGRQQVLKPEHTDSGEMLTRLVPLLSVMLGSQVQLELRLGEDLPPIVVDPLKLEQVVINLALNARDAMPHPGTIVIETRLAAAHELPPACVGRCCVVLSVSDTGIGMDPSTLQHIFEPFFTTRAAQGGTGLGLATVHGIVHQSAGEIRVTSAEGAGTCFDVYLPAASASSGDVLRAQTTAPARDEAETEAESHERSCVVLLVDDEPLVRELGARVLRDGGYTVVLAADGREALEIVGHPERPVDLLLTDVVMPHVNGYQLADLASALRPNLHIAVMSGYNHETSRRLSGASHDRYHVIEKPFAPEQLLQHVAQLLAPCHGGGAALDVARGSGL